MKKLLLCVLSVLMMLSLLVACDSPMDAMTETTEITDPSVDETFEYLDLNITLPGDFAQYQGYVFRNDTYLVRASNMPLSSITPLEGHSFPTLKVFMENHPSLRSEYISVQQDGNLLYIDYATTKDNIASNLTLPDGAEGTQCLVGFQSESNFWIVAFYSKSVDYQTVKSQALEWAKGITFDPAEAEE